MAITPIVQQTWDANSDFTPTRMNNIENNLGIVSDATGVKYSSGVSVKDKIDSVVSSIGNGTLTIQKNSTNVATFTANQSGNATANIQANLTELTTETKEFTVSLNAYDAQAFSVNVAKSGWTAIGVVGFYTGDTEFYFVNIMFASATTVRVDVKSIAPDARTNRTANVKVLYYKNS